MSGSLSFPPSKKLSSNPSSKRLSHARVIEEAKRVQNNLKLRVTISPLKRSPRFVAAVDAAFSKGKVIAAASLFRYPEMEHIEDRYEVRDISFPYIPGYLSFREGPAMTAAIVKFKTRPDIILFDGQGIAHPVGLGLASHIGVLVGIPSVGCAKSRLVGHYREPEREKGSISLLTYHGKTVGFAVRTRHDVRPIFVSPGHMIDLAGALEVVLNCTGRYRIPEPLRHADRLSKKLRS
jgi:deoxyribonuclease V